MPNRKPNRKPKRPAPPITPHAPIVHEVVDPRWIVSALAGTLAVCVLCAYIAVCVLFYRGQWQLVLAPSRAVPQTPIAAGLPSTEIHFADNDAGQPQLDGWWIPADSSYTARPTALLFHGAQGSLANAIPLAHQLHDAQLNVLLFDYRGFGLSTGQHPTQSLMQSDTASALRYLTDTRSIPTSSIVVVGAGLGSSLAVQLCASHKNIPALILISPDGDFDSRARQDSRAHLVPFGLLFNQTFPLAAPLHTLTTPKLLISFTNNPPPPALQQAANPKITVELDPSDDQAIHQAIQRFLSTYLPNS